MVTVLAKSSDRPRLRRLLFTDERLQLFDMPGNSQRRWRGRPDISLAKTKSIQGDGALRRRLAEVVILYFKYEPSTADPAFMTDCAGEKRAT